MVSSWNQSQCTNLLNKKWRNRDDQPAKWMLGGGMYFRNRLIQSTLISWFVFVSLRLKWWLGGLFNCKFLFDTKRYMSFAPSHQRRRRPAHLPREVVYGTFLQRRRRWEDILMLKSIQLIVNTWSSLYFHWIGRGMKGRKKAGDWDANSGRGQWIKMI